MISVDKGFSRFLSGEGEIVSRFLGLVSRRAVVTASSMM